MMSERQVPQPRAGLLGAWDRFVGPGMPADETALVVGTGVLGALFAGLALSAHGTSAWLIALGAIIAFDVVGGAVCNATQTTKRWYHRADAGARDHAGFVALHLFHIVAVAWAFRGDGFDMPYALTVGFCLLAAMALVLTVPQRMKLPIAVLCTVSTVWIVLAMFGATPGLEWFVPALLLKLLVGHLVP